MCLFEVIPMKKSYHVIFKDGLGLVVRAKDKREAKKRARYFLTNNPKKDINKIEII